MKKIIIAVVVLLAGALIGLKYFAAKNQAGLPQPAAEPRSEQQGVALPAGSADTLSPASAASFAPAPATGTYELLALPAAALELKGACEGGAPKEIMENHGKTWGYVTGTRNAFEPKNTQEIYEYLWAYYACTAAARQSSDICSELPGEAVKDAVKFGVPAHEVAKGGGNVSVMTHLSPMEQCRSRSVEFLFKAYVAGKAKDQQNCTDYLSEMSGENLARISPPEFCAAGAQGPEKALAYVKEKMPEVYPMAEKMLATSKKVCGSSSECLSNNRLWEGISTGDPAKCPDAYKPNCAALAQKSPAPCAGILAEMSKKYCGYYKVLLKQGGGYAGVTPEETQAALKAEAKKKAEEELLRKQAEATTKEVNEKARKLMGKKGE